MMRFIRLNNTIDRVKLPNNVDTSTLMPNADTIEDLIQEGDLVRYLDKTCNLKSYCELDKFFMPHHTAIYRVIELYIKQPNGDFKLVAIDKGNYKLELV